MPTVSVLLVKTSRLKPPSVLTSYRITASHRTPKFPSLSTAYNLTRNGAVYFQGSFLPFQDELGTAEVQKRRTTSRLAGPSLSPKADMLIYLAPPKLVACDHCYPWWRGRECFSSSRRLWSSVCRSEGLGLPQPHTPCSDTRPVPSEYVTDAICLTWHHKIWSNTLNKSKGLKLRANSLVWCIQN